LSELDTSAKIKSYYALSTTVIEEIRRKREEVACKLKDIDDAAKDIPSLL
ncbi:MAG: cell division protein FtsZ, partial [Dehalococcoidales bacterium]|nr:cell division protein FtsZ [Dehalococcoidales bacterium]